jgi:Protein of unknown function (DUF3808)
MLREALHSDLQLGRGVISFVKAALGFEPEFMREGRTPIAALGLISPELTRLSNIASECLGDAENSAWHDLRNAQRDPTSYRSAIYPPGSEYALCNAEAQLMGAVVGVLNESLTESIKAFYKLRKAYVALHAIVEAENTYMRGMGYRGVSEQHSLELEIGETTEPPIDAGIESKVGTEGLTFTNETDENEPPSVIDTAAVRLDLLEGNLEAALSLASTKAPVSRSPTPSSNSTPIENDITTKVSEHPIDAFIHSGTCLCFGLLLLMISMIPPVFGRLLYIIGVSGDREKGLKMLWQATRFENINGAMAGLTLLGYYNGITGVSDILLDQDDNMVGYPKKNCQELLAQMRSRYPKSQLWHLEAARMEAANCRLETALELLNSEEESQMKQVVALVMFERSLDSMYLHRYGDTADFFMKVCFPLWLEICGQLADGYSVSNLTTGPTHYTTISQAPRILNSTAGSSFRIQNKQYAAPRLPTQHPLRLLRLAAVDKASRRSMQIKLRKSSGKSRQFQEKRSF